MYEAPNNPAPFNNSGDGQTGSLDISIFVNLYPYAP
jgi:hypothetical protein